MRPLPAQHDIGAHGPAASSRSERCRRSRAMQHRRALDRGLQTAKPQKTPAGLWLIGPYCPACAVKGRVALSPRSGVPNERNRTSLTCGGVPNQRNRRSLKCGVVPNEHKTNLLMRCGGGRPSAGALGDRAARRRCRDSECGRPPGCRRCAPGPARRARTARSAAPPRRTKPATR